MKIPELLAPAGDLEKLKVALAFGADAVYLGAPDFSLRVGENKFGVPQIRKAVEICRAAKKKIYFTTNTFPRDHEFGKLENFLRKLRATPPDAFIFSDLGVLATLRKFFPKVAKHLSVQANSVNSRTVREWGKLGVSRIILARELSFREIKKIVATNPKMEFEVFVHGAICMSYSGRCLLSNFLTGRDANRGECAQPCRWKYSLVEEKRLNEFLPIEEDSAGSYILNSRDLALIEKIPQLAKIGICSFKIEGRNKSLGYLATIVRVYRRALDTYFAGKKFDRKLWSEIRTTGNRDFTLGFFDGDLKNLQNYERSTGENPQNFVGLVEKNSGGKILITPKNRIEVGVKIEAVPPSGEIRKLEIEKIFDEKMVEVPAAHGGQRSKIWLEVSGELPQFTLLRKC